MGLATFPYKWSGLPALPWPSTALPKKCLCLLPKSISNITDLEPTSLTLVSQCRIEQNAALPEGKGELVKA